MSVETKEIGEQIARRERQYASVVSVHHLRCTFLSAAVVVLSLQSLDSDYDYQYSSGRRRAGSRLGTAAHHERCAVFGLAKARPSDFSEISVAF